MNASRHGPKMGPEEAARLEAARQRMLARHKLIDDMIRNNEQQLRNESARGGAEIERECARREAAAAGGGPGAAEAAAALAVVERRLAGLEAERRRLVSERDWLDTALRDFDGLRSAGDDTRAGHA